MHSAVMTFCFGCKMPSVAFVSLLALFSVSFSSVLKLMSIPIKDDIVAEN